MAASTKAKVPLTCFKSGEGCAKAAREVVRRMNTPEGFDVTEWYTSRFAKCVGPAKTLQQAAANILDHTIALGRYRAAGMREQVRLAKVNLEHAVGVYDETLARLKRLRARKKHTKKKSRKRQVA